MNAFLDSLKSDLLDRRLTPLLALLGAALLGAVVYAALAGSGSSSAPAGGAPAPTPKTAGIAVSAVKTDTNSSVAETTSGAAEQTGGASRNPFAPTPGAKPASAKKAVAGSAGSTSPAGGSGAATGSTTSTESGASAGGSSSESGSSTQSGGTQPETEQPAQSKPKKTYRVSVLFGTAAPGVPVLEAGLTSYEHLARQQLLPSAKRPVIVFRGVVAGGKSATFTLVGEAIPHGDAVCRPSAAQCQAIDLKAGDTEELEYVPLGASPVTYELHLLKIEQVRAKSARKASAASADALVVEESKVGLKLLRREGLLALPGMRYSRDGGVLVFVAARHPSARHAHAASRGAAARS